MEVIESYFLYLCMYFRLLYFTLLFGSFGLSTKEPYTIMLCPSCVVVGIVLRWHRCLCTPPPGIGLDIETLYLVYICPPYVHIKYLVILTCSY